MATRGKKYSEAAQKIEKGKVYSIEEAVKLARETATTKFDSTIEMHFRLGVDPKHADQIVRGTIVLPHGTGKAVRVIAFVSDDKEKAAKDAGAIEAGSTELIEKISKGWMDFDVAVATPDMMKGIAKIAKTLGQKGLMPNPKSGTVTTDIEKTIGDLMKGKVEFRTDKFGLIHNAIGKVSFDEAKILENAKALVKAIRDAKPSGAKGTYMKTLTITTSMGPGIRVDTAA